MTSDFIPIEVSTSEYQDEENPGLAGSTGSTISSNAAISALLDALRMNSIVGRQEELAAFAEMLQGSAHRVLLVHGKKGMGKSTLLREFARQARASGRTVLELDGSSESGADRKIRADLSRLGLGIRAGESGVQLDPHLVPHPNFVLLIDDADQVQMWLRTELLPRLPASSVVVVTLTAPPHTDWTIDLGWRSLVRVVRPGFLPLDDCAELLTQLGIDTDERQIFLGGLTRGHPLELTLLTQVWPDLRLGELREHPERVTVLLKSLVASPPDPLHAEALFVCAHAAVLANEDLLRRVLDCADVSVIWSWLGSLGVVMTEPAGLSLSPLVCGLVEAEMLHRSPDRFHTLHARVHRYFRDVYRRNYAALQPMASLRVFAAHPSSALAALRGDLIASCVTRIPMIVRCGRVDDHPEVLRMIARSGGVTEAALARDWLDSQPESLYVMESGGQLIAAAVNVVVRPDAPAEHADPVVRSVLDHAEGWSVTRPGNSVHILRFLTGRAACADSKHALAAGLVAAMHSWLTAEPSIAFTVIPRAAGWQQVFEDMAMRPVGLPESEAHSAFELDFRRCPLDDWLEFMAHRELTGGSGALPEEVLRPAPLTYEEFSRAVRGALRDLHRTDQLAVNPLADGYLTQGNGWGAGEELRNRIIWAVSSIGTGQKDHMLINVLKVTFLQSEPSQKAAAKALHMPFSTYRRYLAQGVQRLVDQLWAAEDGQDSAVHRPEPTAMGS